MGYVLMGLAGVAATLGWLEFLAWRERKAERRRECEMRGHQWGKPFFAMGTDCRDCRHCGVQQHRNKEGDWY